jgi:SPP1 family predicted phage head-tail adaptor
MSKSGREFIAAKTMQPELDSMLELPFDSVTSQITPRDRVLMNGRILNVAAAYDPTNNREKIVLEVMEPVAC